MLWPSPYTSKMRVRFSKVEWQFFLYFSLLWSSLVLTVVVSFFLWGFVCAQTSITSMSNFLLSNYFDNCWQALMCLTIIQNWTVLSFLVNDAFWEDSLWGLPRVSKFVVYELLSHPFIGQNLGFVKLQRPSFGTVSSSSSISSHQSCLLFVDYKDNLRVVGERKWDTGQ